MAERSNGWGGKRPNQGRKRGKKARVYLRLTDEDAQSLHLLTKHRRATSGNPDVLEETIVGELVNQAWNEIEQSATRAEASKAQEPYIL